MPHYVSSSHHQQAPIHTRVLNNIHTRELRNVHEGVEKLSHKEVEIFHTRDKIFLVQTLETSLNFLRKKVPRNLEHLANTFRVS
jgi:hypothetical protein